MSFSRDCIDLRSDRSAHHERPVYAFPRTCARGRARKGHALLELVSAGQGVDLFRDHVVLDLLLALELRLLEGRLELLDLVLEPAVLVCCVTRALL